MRLIKRKKYEVYEHLEHYVRRTTYAHRLQWLEEANDFVRKIHRKHPISRRAPWPHGPSRA